MKFANWIKVPKDFPPEAMDEIMKRYNKFHPGQFHYEKGRLMKLTGPLEVRFYEQDADNFIKNLVTVVTKMNGFFVPRIIKKMHNKHRNRRKLTIFKRCFKNKF